MTCASITEGTDLRSVPDHPPKSRDTGLGPEFWHEKIEGNIAGDQRNLAELKELGWRVCTLWECEVKGAGKN